jgi:FtsH-binding integral membrane protein
MSRYPNGPFNFRPAGSTLGYESNVDSVTQSRFFNAVYAWMSTGLALTAVVAWAVANSPVFHPLATSFPLLIVAFIAELGLVMAISGAINRINASVATALFLLYAALNGFTLSILFARYSLPSLGGTFLVTAGTFAAMSVYGYTTRRDLTRLGSFLFMALIGLVIASVVCMFVASSLLYWGITYAGVLIFVGLTAYDTQRLREVATQTGDNPAMASRLAVVGSLVLYLDFINLFLLLLRVLNDRRN